MNKTSSVYYPQIPLSRYGDAQPGAEAPQRCGEEGGSWPRWRPAERHPRSEGGREPSLAGHAGESHKFSSLHKPAHQKGALHTRGLPLIVKVSYQCLIRSTTAYEKNVTKKFLCPEWGMFWLWQKCLRLTQILTCGPFFFVSVCLSLSVSFRLFKTGSSWRRCWTGFSCGPSSQCQYWELS